MIYICNPNNPTGTVTGKEDILWALENKPEGSVLLVDEAYIHLSDEETAWTRWRPARTDRAAHLLEDLRHGRHPLRLCHRRPDLLDKLQAYGQNPMPVTGAAAATASLTTRPGPTRKK